MIELELKAVVPDPSALRNALLAAGAQAGFAGRLHDRRYDRDGELLARDEVLRTRRFDGAAGGRTRVSWKGPVSVAGGYKRRDELEYEAEGVGAVGAVFEALGYRMTEAIDRYVEYYELGGATIRIEWYPRMDVLVEVEGDPASIEAAVRAMPLARDAFTSEALPVFVARFEARTGGAAVTALADLIGEEPAWPAPAARA